MYRPQRRTVVPTDLAYNHEGARRQAPPPIEVPSTESYHESAATAAAAPTNIIHNHYYAHDEAPIRLGAQSDSYDYYYIGGRDRKHHGQYSQDMWFYCCVISWAVLSLVILGLIIAICCVSASARRSFYHNPFIQQQSNVRWP